MQPVSSKVYAGTLGAAVAQMVVWGMESSGLNVETFPELGLAVFFTFALGWLVPEWRYVIAKEEDEDSKFNST